MHAIHQEIDPRKNLIDDAETISEKKTAVRLYKVAMGNDVHIVKASSQSQAIRHIVKSKVSCEVLSAVDAVTLVGAGCAVEVAGSEEGV